jgi:D-sedoheptulose 7-phosphate isomerase
MVAGLKGPRAMKNYIDALSYAAFRYEVAIKNAVDRIVAMEAAVIYLVGNGGSSTIASHIAVDLQKNYGRPAMAFNDPAFITCLGNDLGFEEIFAHHVKHHCITGDMLIAISSSGRSENILKAAKQARQNGTTVITLSGFDSDNPLRIIGDINFHVPSHSYGVVETTHLAILHHIVDQLPPP